MDEETQQAMTSIGANNILLAQVGVLTLAVRALISTHPDRAQLEAVFDQMLSQSQADRILLDSRDFSLVTRHLSVSLFDTEQ